MPLVGPMCTFHELPVLVDFQASLPDARRVMAAIAGLVYRLRDSGTKVDELPTAIVALVAEYGYGCRLVGRTREAIEFSVTRL
jgi:hypothetical protein